jgi:hypothetical protein
MAKLIVLKPFMFTHPSQDHIRIAHETKFVPGIYHDVPSEIADHPWIKAGADGKVETAAQTGARLKAEAKIKKDQDAANAIATAEAEAAVGRIAKAEAASSQRSAAEIEAELNTPVNELKKRGAGAGVTAKP